MSCSAMAESPALDDLLAGHPVTGKLNDDHRIPLPPHGTTTAFPQQRAADHFSRLSQDGHYISPVHAVIDPGIVGAGQPGSGAARKQDNRHPGHQQPAHAAMPAGLHRAFPPLRDTTT